MNYIVEKGIELPPKSHKGKGHMKYPELATMLVGECLTTYEDGTGKALAAASSHHAKKSGKLFTTRKKANQYRIFRIK
jgi:hypothetical protein